MEEIIIETIFISLIVPNRSSGLSRIDSKREKSFSFFSFNSSILLSPKDEMAISEAVKNPDSIIKRKNKISSTDDVSICLDYNFKGLYVA